MGLRGVIFDVGGTLVQGDRGRFEEVAAWTAAKTLRAWGRELDPEAFRERLAKLRALPTAGPDHLQLHPTRAALRLAAGACGVPLAPAELDRLEEAFYAAQVAAARAIPGVPELVRELRGRVRLAVVSNTRSHLLIEGMVERVGLAGLFDPFVTSARAGVRKPAPRLFRGVLEAWGLEPAEVAVVGDRMDHDVRPAAALGLRGVWFTPDARPGQDGRGAAATAADAAELRALLRDWLAEAAPAAAEPGA